MAYLGLAKRFCPNRFSFLPNKNFLHQWSAFLYPSFFIFCAFVTWPEDEENYWYPHQRARPFSCLHASHDISWSLWVVLFWVVGWVWPPLSHSLCMHPKWDKWNTHLEKVWKGSTLQRTFVFGDEKKETLQVPVGWRQGVLTWNSWLKYESNTGHIIWS